MTSEMFRGPQEIRDAYRDEGVAREYIGRRFQEPLGALLHDRQVAAVRGVLRRTSPGRVLELAPGPARLTVDLAGDIGRLGTAVDASLQMLEEARRRLRAAQADGGWKFVQADAFNLPLGGPFDLVYTFRLIRHFGDEDRRRIYRQLHRVMRPGGRLVFDAVNERVSAPLRERNPEEYRHYDALLTADGVRRELGECGFDVESLEGVQHRVEVQHRLQTLVAPRSRPLARGLMELVERTGGEPLEWIVTCRRV